MEQGGCPHKLITDLGTENGLMASIHSFFSGCFKQPSLRSISQESEDKGVVVLLQKKQSKLVDKLFEDLKDQGTFDPASELESGCLWFCFAPLPAARY